MSVDDYGVSPYNVSHHEESPWPAQPLPIVNATEEAAPEFGACMTWNIPQSGVGQPVQVLQRRVRRSKARLTLVSVAGATAIVINSKLDPLASIQQGATYATVGNLPTWESQQPLYVIAIGGTAILSVIDEAYGER